MKNLLNKSAVIGAQVLVCSALLTGNSYAIFTIPEATVPEPGPAGLLLLGGLALLITRLIKRGK